MPLNNSKVSVNRQSEFIKRHGESVKYSQGMKCTCTLSQTGYVLDPNRANPNCKACNGLGWVWLDKGKIIGMVTNISQHKELLQSGIASPGDLVFSPNIPQTLSDYDRIQLTWKEGIPYEGELITRSDTSDTDTANYSILDVSECITVDPVTGDVAYYVKDTDFTIEGRSITWDVVGGSEPDPGTPYSIKYSALVDWIVFAPPQPRRERGTNLGQKVLLRKKHVVFNGV